MDTVMKSEKSTSTLFRSAQAVVSLDLIQQPLQLVESRLRRELRSRFEMLTPILQHGTMLGGKRMRPALVLLAANAAGEPTDDHITIATVMEMVHTATLVHDDVLDAAATRRHVPTVNAKWDSQTSILVGDYLFAQSFYLAATLKDTLACQWIGEAARRVCEGELRQVHSRDELDLNEENYLSIVQGKTAELCRVACRLGAAYAGAPSDHVTALAEYGDALGIAFQIADDYLDLWGDSERTGKTLGTDLLQAKMTLPMIRLLETSSPQQHQQIIQILRGPAESRLPQLQPLLQASDARSYTKDRAQAFADQALQSLTVLPDSPAKQLLSDFARFAIERRF